MLLIPHSANDPKLVSRLAHDSPKASCPPAAAASLRPDIPNLHVVLRQHDTTVSHVHAEGCPVCRCSHDPLSLFGVLAAALNLRLYAPLLINQFVGAYGMQHSSSMSLVTYTCSQTTKC